MEKKIKFSHKGNEYELRILQKHPNEYTFKFGIIKNKRISYKETNLFHQYYIFNFITKEIYDFLYKTKFTKIEYIVSKKMNSINQYILKKCLLLGFVHETIEENGFCKTIIKNDEVFLNLLAELNEFESTK